LVMLGLVGGGGGRISALNPERDHELIWNHNEGMEKTEACQPGGRGETGTRERSV